MGLLDINCAALDQLAADCQSLGVQIGAASIVEPVAAGWWATAVAVSAANADITLAAQVMAARMYQTAAGLVTVSRQFTATDKLSAAYLRALVTEV
ncbi:hypothetical protein [Mycolicibacterium helvum]|uniref:PE family protein n=1 Tax=Mycolicibacterium helvum TaxID=1534349 RepID=A0A7I7T5E8_9MYCO|nr:hypothetical protein [Mycolicibacterium helvum]BBY64288.1 hypothetical protein MHEL_25310 [Mycolicibacterium helvum]